MRRSRKTVAMFLSTDGTFVRGVLAGALRYVQQNSVPWDVRLMGRIRPGTTAELIRECNPDGVLTCMEESWHIEALRRLRLPTVNADDTALAPDIPTVAFDGLEVGRTVARHFLERGFKNFGFMGNTAYYSRQRQEGFQAQLRDAGFPCSLLRHRTNPTQYLNIDREKVKEWLLRQPRPLAVMTCHDAYGMHLVNLCHEAGLLVPDEVAVVGVDDDDVFCFLCPQPLSSVPEPGNEIGYEAAAMLDRWMNGRKPAPGQHLLKPRGVVLRRSSDVSGAADPVVRRAMHFIRDHFAEGISVLDILKEISVSRPALDQKFRDALNRTAAEEIWHVRVETAKRLLAETDIKVEEVSRRAGFSGYFVFYTIFRRRVGLSPAEYRRQAERGIHEKRLGTA